MSKRDKTNSKIILLAFTLIVLIGFFFVQTSPKEVSYQIGNFTITFPQDHIYTTRSYDSAEKVEVNVSRISNQHCPLKVGGVRHLLVDKKQEGVVHGLSPSIIVWYWDESELSYADEETKSLVESRLEVLANLQKYSGQEDLLSNVFSGQYSSNMPVADNINLSPWRGLTSCGGHFSYPIYIESVETSEFDKAFYFEAFEGQDFTLPSKGILVTKGDEWIMIKEDHLYGFEENYPKVDLEHCIQENEGEDIYKTFECIEPMWDEFYRSREKISNWSSSILDSLEYTN